MAVADRPILETLSVSESRKQYSELLDRAYRGELFVIEKSGIPIAGIVPIGAVQAAEEKARTRLDLIDSLDKLRANFDGTPEEEIEREVEKAIAEVEAERRFARRVAAIIAKIAPGEFTMPDKHLEDLVAAALSNEARQRADGAG